ncbi:hypothetical protein A9Q81_24175 [Gammaproteobacteria bacterium 42_54_T18]|nr:hypothetical protein A9Q81_24175 [Gammaproteobacteria bacterium 42_54_T18]
MTPNPRNKPSVTPKNNLTNACHLRSAIIASLLIALSVAHDILLINIDLMRAALPLFLLALFNTLHYWKLRKERSISSNLLVAQLALDILLLTISFYFSGGPSNPFISFYLIPLTISATLLSPAFTGIATLTTFIAYTCLLIYAPQPTQMLMQHQHGGQSNQFNIHLIGMWINFALSASLITYFIIRLNIEISLRDHAISNYKQKLTQGEQVFGLATLATGAAHEISTPLSTIAVTIGDLLQAPNTNGIKDDLVVIEGQIKECKAILSQLTAEAGQQRAGYQRPAKDSFTYLQHLINRLKIMRPLCTATLKSKNTATLTNKPKLLISPAPTIDQAIINLINNACDASPNFVELQYFIIETELIVEISDKGPGIDPNVLEHIGEPYISSGKEHGLGLGLFLANSTFELFGGSLSLHNKDEGGTLTRISLPLNSIT